MANELLYGTGSIASAPQDVSPGDTLVRGTSRTVSPSVSSGGRLTYSGVTFPATTESDRYFWVALPAGDSLVSITSDEGSRGLEATNWVQLSSNRAVYVFHKRLLAGVSDQIDIVVAKAASPTNRPPVVTNPIANQVLTVGIPVNFDLENVFEDPDADALTYTAVSSAEALLSADISVNRLTITPLAVGGPVTVTITATDRRNASAVTDVAFDVHAAAVPNRPPVSVGTIPNQSVEEGTTDAFSVVGYFRDPDGNIDHWSAISSDTSIASVQSITGGVVTYNALAVGSVVLTISATDAEGQSVDQRMKVSVTEATTPTVDHQPVVLVSIADQQMVEDESRTFNNISGHFSDLDGDPIFVSVTKVTDRYACNAVLQGNALVLEAGNVGTSVVYLRGTDRTTNRSVGMSFQVQVFEDASSEHPVAPEGVTDFIRNRWIELEEFIAYASESKKFDDIPNLDDNIRREYGMAYEAAKQYIEDYAPLAPQVLKNQCLERFAAALHDSNYTPSDRAYLPSDLFVSSGARAVLYPYRLIGVSS